ncbi:MAG: response regulator transcription factor [Deferrisomatales bacterium]
MSGTKRIYLVEDHPIFRLGLRELIDEEADLQVCGETDDVGRALAEIGALRPDVVIVDIGLKGRSGLDLIKEVRDRYGDGVPTLVLSMYDEALYAERSLHAGARGYIMKQEAAESIVQALRCVLRGKVYLSENVVGQLVGKMVGRPQGADQSPVERLTDRELEVFRLIGRGRTTREIAATLHLSTKTIGTYRERIKEKLGLKNAAELVRHAVHWIESEAS